MSPSFWSTSLQDGPVLVLRALGLGDTLTALPALRGLRRLVTPRPVILAVADPLGRWLTDLGVVDRWIATHGLDGPLPGRDLGVHDAVDLHGNGPLSRHLLTSARPRRLLAFAAPGGVGEQWREDEHEVHRWCRLVSSVGAQCAIADLRIPCGATNHHHGIAHSLRAGPVVIHPGAAHPSRRWPAERWAEVARALHQQGHRVVLTGNNAEQRLCSAVAQAAGLVSLANTAGTLSLPGLTELICSARMLLVGDTGVAHLATATSTPSVVLFGPVSPTIWGPVGNGSLHRVLWRGDYSARRPDGSPLVRPGNPHGASPDPRLLGITVDEVLAAAAAVVD
ncbi:MAG: glycosyltransferase family 9 protein [Actinomycetota bacterium]